MIRRPPTCPDDATLARVRELTQRKLDRQALRMRPMRRALRRGTWKPARRRMSRLDAFELMRDRRRDLAYKRNAAVAGFAGALQWNPELGRYVDELTPELDKRGARELRHCQVRAAVAAKLRDVARWAHAHGIAAPEQFSMQAEKLERARRVAWFGRNTETGELVLRFVDRSGLALLDPSEARERQATLCARLVPVLQSYARAGCLIYYAVFSAPNVPAGALAFGKRQLFDRFKAVILAGAVPEIVGAFAVQEDPLAADLESWNVHLNVILVVDPERCTPLPFDLCWQLDLDLATPHGPPARELGVDPAPPGTLSFSKLHYLWGAHQVELRKLKARSADALARSIREIVKYSAKWISTKQLDQLDQLASITQAGSVPVVNPQGTGETGIGSACAPDRFALDGARHRSRGRPAAPGVVDWPEARVAEWIRANQGTRRVRGWGALYRLAKHQLPPDPEKQGKVLWLGRAFVDPRGFALMRFRRSEVDSIHGDKSGHNFSAASARGLGAQARAGPSSAPAFA